MEPSIWTEPVVNDLRALAEARFSAAKIAAQLCCKHGISVTRSAVIGKAFRAEITLRQGKSQPRQRMSRDEANRRRRDHHLAAKLTRPKTLGLKFDPVLDTPIEFEVKGRTILTIEQGECRWPVNEPGAPFMFCGNEKYGELPYCVGHARLAYRSTRG